MDGNNRWSKKKSISKYDSYKIGATKLIKLSNFIFSQTDISYVSAFALSKNNLDRSSSILNTIKKILSEYLVELSNTKLTYDLKFIGDFSFFDTKTKNLIDKFNRRKGPKKKLYIYLNYGGREDIQQAFYNCKNKKNYESCLLTKNLPDPDLLIRTGGFKRISNFMLYQIAFTELYFLNKLWPDFNKSDLKKIISNYLKIDRKFGK